LLLAFANPLAEALVGGRELGGVSAAAVADALRVLAVALPFAALLDTWLGATRGYQDMWPTVAIDRVGRSCLQLLGALAAALLGTAALLAPLWAFAYIPSAVVAWFWMRRLRRRSLAHAASPPRGHRTSSPDSPGFWAFTAPRALATSVQIVIQRLDIVLVGIIRGPAVAAVYAAATRFLVVGQLGNTAISMASQPQLSYLFARRNRLGAHAVYQATTAWLVLLTWPLYLLAISYGPAILSVFGPGYGAGP
jgi:O-antigen/teichoic acid export membrane protein